MKQDLLRDLDLMKRLPLADLSLLNLDGQSVPMSEIIKRTSLVIFLRHLG
jgi:hypothetical protein